MQPQVTFPGSSAAAAPDGSQPMSTGIDGTPAAAAPGVSKRMDVATGGRAQAAGGEALAVGAHAVGDMRGPPRDAQTP